MWALTNVPNWVAQVSRNIFYPSVTNSQEVTCKARGNVDPLWSQPWEASLLVQELRVCRLLPSPCATLEEQQVPAARVPTGCFPSEISLRSPPHSSAIWFLKISPRRKKKKED
jgi:hypothetical protein